ncbi:uncharacterized protein DUF2730 [Rhodobacter maris]|uniref:Uncharacterized protein DUF2730 n=2 Tax=Rhodobacter maris TaxID=446682 RepID=A0A285TBQ4_9RHOB|nr:uncharacterized protein DUF2730 [Rhodobacter maris]
MTGALDIGPVVVWAAGLSTLISLGTTIFAWLTSGSRKNDERLDRLVARVDELERLVQTHGDKIDQLPNQEMMHRLELSLVRMEGHIDRMDERLRPVAAIAERMQELMLEQAKEGRK